MLYPSLSRFHWVLIGAGVLGGLGLVVGSAALCLGVMGALLVIIVLGVTWPQFQLFGQFVCRGAGTRRRVSLTFDDGPDGASTPALLDLLRESGVQAAFFGVGERVAAHPELAARIVREGHLLENHSYTHSHLTNFFGRTRLRTELERAQSAIRDATGVAPKLFRPPMGLSNPRVFSVARAMGLRVIGWSARGLDTVTDEPERVLARIVRRLQPGAIILLHDGNMQAGRLLLTVQRLLARLREHNYEVVRLDILLE